MYIRQKIILSFIKNALRPVSKTQLVKWAFLFAQEKDLAKLKHFYRFVPYKYGPYSFSLYYDLNGLVNTSYIVTSPKGSISVSGEVPIPPVDKDVEFEIQIFLNKYKNFSYKRLTEHVYNSYPWYSINASNPELRINKRPKARKAVYTAGYESLQIDEFMNFLMRYGIHQLVDIRNNPVARRYGFHKSTLSNICGKLDIDYHHFPELGIPSELRSSLSSPEDYDTLFKGYNRTVLAKQKDSIDSVAKLIRRKPTVLVCMEADDKFCHRRLLANRISKATSLPFTELKR